MKKKESNVYYWIVFYEGVHGREMVIKNIHPFTFMKTIVEKNKGILGNWKKITKKEYDAWGYEDVQQ